jgi:hypothetical protein
MKCKLCKNREANNHYKTLDICDKCLVDIQLSFTYYINGKECVKEDIERIKKT